MRQLEPRTGVSTFVPLVGKAFVSNRFSVLEAYLGHKWLKMVLRDGSLQLDRGLILCATIGAVMMTAVTGWTGRHADAFTQAPAETRYLSDAKLKEVLDYELIKASMQHSD